MKRSDETNQNNLCAINKIQNKALEVIMSYLDEIETENFGLDTSFSSIQMNSIVFIKIVVALEAEFDFEFDDEMLLISAFPTIKSMTEYVEKKAN